MKWETKEIRVAADKEITVSARCLGPLAFHKAVETRFKYSVTHIPTGLKVTVTDRQRDARSVVTYLCEHHLDLFSIPTDQEICAKIPGWLVRWLRAVRGGWVDPSEFEPKEVANGSQESEGRLRGSQSDREEVQQKAAEQDASGEAA